MFADRIPGLAVKKKKKIHVSGNSEVESERERHSAARATNERRRQKVGLKVYRHPSIHSPECTKAVKS